jgi:hypothetical protein
MSNPRPGGLFRKTSPQSGPPSVSGHPNRTQDKCPPSSGDPHSSIPNSINLLSRKSEPGAHLVFRPPTLPRSLPRQLTDQRLIRPTVAHLITCVSCAQRPGGSGSLTGCFGAWTAPEEEAEEGYAGEESWTFSSTSSSSLSTSLSAWLRCARMCWRAASAS